MARPSKEKRVFNDVYEAVHSLDSEERDALIETLGGYFQSYQCLQDQIDDLEADDQTKCAQQIRDAFESAKRAVPSLPPL